MNKNQYSFSMWLQYLEKMNKKNKNNLFDLKLIAHKLGLLNLKSFFFTVGGTNGKGTTCALLEKFFLKSGYQVGLYTSPHLINYIERVKINGLSLDKEHHVFSFLNVERAKNNISLTYFEFITLSALFLFKQYSLDIIILEVGLGGRLDATNIIDTDCAIITNIGIDHTDLLGSDRISIGYEKSGIFRTGKIAVVGDNNVPCSVDRYAKDIQAILKKVNVHYWFLQKNRYKWSFFHPIIQLHDLPLSKIPLSNAAIALSSLYYSDFKINLNILKDSISEICLPGRFQTILRAPRVILDVAHNVDAAFYLSKQIDKIIIPGKLYVIIGVLKDKNIAGIIQPFQNKVHTWYASILHTNRTANMSQLKKCFPINNTVFFNNVNCAWNSVKSIAKKEDVILIFGSFFVVSEFISSIKKDKNIILDRL